MVSDKEVFYPPITAVIGLVPECSKAPLVVVVDTLGQARVSGLWIAPTSGQGTEILADGDPRHNYKPDIMN